MSPGGATALYTAFGCPAASQEQQFAAVMALSSWMPLHKSLMTSVGRIYLLFHICTYLSPSLKPEKSIYVNDLYEQRCEFIINP